MADVIIVIMMMIIIIIIVIIIIITITIIIIIIIIIRPLLSWIAFSCSLHLRMARNPKMRRESPERQCTC